MKTAPFFAARRTGRRLRVRATKHLEGSQPVVWRGTRVPVSFKPLLWDYSLTKLLYIFISLQLSLFYYVVSNHLSISINRQSIPTIPSMYLWISIISKEREKFTAERQAHISRFLWTTLSLNDVVLRSIV